MENAARIGALRQAADMGWADVEAGRYLDIADEYLDDVIARLGAQASGPPSTA